MALTVGTGPFGNHPAGTFNFTPDTPDHVLYLEDSPRRVRAVVAGETVADSRRAKLLHETGRLPVYYVPQEDVRMDLLETSDRTAERPATGTTQYWTVRVGDDVREDAAFSHPAPPEGAPRLEGHLAFSWDAIDGWWEEAEQVGVHPRDPYHRCDVLRSDRHVVVRVAGQVIAESRRPTMLFETGLRPRYYLPHDDVDLARLEVSTTVTACPYKGTTSRYYTAVVDGERVEDLAWVYDSPHAEVRGIAGLVAFYDEKVELEVEVT